MSRWNKGNATEMWRAVIVTTYPPSRKRPDGHTTTRYAGPFLAKGQATAAINRARDDEEFTTRSSQREVTPEVTGYPERSPLVWEKVPA